MSLIAAWASVVKISSSASCSSTAAWAPWSLTSRWPGSLDLARHTVIPTRKVIAVYTHALGDELKHVTFVGGAATALYVDDPAAPDVRPTNDIDCAVETVTYTAFSDLERLCALNNHQDRDEILSRYFDTDEVGRARAQRARALIELFVAKPIAPEP